MQVLILKWIFPDINIDPNEYLVIFASGKDKISDKLHTNFKISSDGEDLILTDNGKQIIDQIAPSIVPFHAGFAGLFYR